MPLTVLVDDHAAIVGLRLRAVSGHFGLNVIGPTNDCQEAVKLASLHQPDFAILNDPLAFLDPIDIVRGIRRASPRTRIILLTMYTQGRTVLSGLRAGACAVIVKSAAFEELLRILSGMYMSADHCDSLHGRHVGCGEPREPQLHGRRRQVLQLVAEGRTTKDIAIILGISVRTAEFHKREIKEKLDIHDTAGWFDSRSEMN